MEDSSNLYPSKPKLKEEESKSNWSLTAFSLVVFILSFLVLFSDNIQFLIFLIVVLFIHELGHFLFMKLFKYKNVRMMFVPLMGAFVQGAKKVYSQKESFMVVMGGPIPGLLLGVVGAIIAFEYEMSWLLELSAVFVLLNMINLLPLDPLDGGQLFRLLVKYDHDLFLMIFSLVSSLILIGIGFIYNSYPLIIFGFLMSFRVRSIQKRYLVRKTLSERDIKYQLTYDELTDMEYARIRSVVIEQNASLKRYKELANANADKIIAEHVNTVLEIPLIQDTSIFFKLVVILLWLLSFLAPVYLFLEFGSRFAWYII
jgi:Zn-dependent protease